MVPGSIRQRMKNINFTVPTCVFKTSEDGVDCKQVIN
jgi:hypothetical protein